MDAPLSISGSSFLSVLALLCAAAGIILLLSQMRRRKRHDESQVLEVLSDTAADALLNEHDAAMLLGDLLRQVNYLPGAVLGHPQSYLSFHLNVPGSSTFWETVTSKLPPYHERSLTRRFQEQCAEQSLLLERALPIAERLYGPESLQASVVLYGLALLKRHAGQLVEAKAAIDRAASIQDNIFCPHADHEEALSVARLLRLDIHQALREAGNPGGAVDFERVHIDEMLNISRRRYRQDW
jgi:hypothetical protein